MKFECLAAELKEPVFELAFVRQLFGISESARASLAVQLSRWEACGKIVRLRRGLYALANQKRNNLDVANRLIEPSYISGEYALSYYGLIQDATFEVTSACLHTPRRALMEIGLSRYSYRQTKVFDGFEAIEMDGKKVLFASPEKALIDTWHWSVGAWTLVRHQGMRYENRRIINAGRLRKWAGMFSPRVVEAAKCYLEVKHNEE